jgi:uncharacterized protein (DUF1778 family)
MRFEQAMDGLIQIRVGRTEKQALRVAATRKGLTLSEYVRETAIQAVAKVAA